MEYCCDAPVGLRGSLVSALLGIVDEATSNHFIATQLLGSFNGLIDDDVTCYAVGGWLHGSTSVEMGHISHVHHVVMSSIVNALHLDIHTLTTHLATYLNNGRK